MAAPLRPSLLPQCPACARRFVGWGLGNARPPRQQIRGKKKRSQGPLTMPVKLLRDLTGFGKAGAFVPITSGQFRNDWYPKGIADYIPHRQLKELKLQNVPFERNHSYVAPEDMETPPEILVEPEEVAKSTPLMRLQHLSPERSVELLQIFIPARIDFYRQPIEAEPAPAEDRTPAVSAAASILSAAAASEKSKTSASASIFGSVSTSDVATSIRAVLAENDEAGRIVLSDDDVQFVRQTVTISEEKDRVKHLGEFEVEIHIKGAPEAVKRIVRVLPSEAGKTP
ncbi:hypothetical protein NA57DRAFT_58149 [Rhizodiscina lignyota]|uniref:Ribosomal protein L9 domain-containing protein n=1 Tax=Rhizodiscina lignyota TaxID=1504668 RepID=A0A9P4M533_9PEZI|nr:hypothetical protein NA57DRAFT_58149 [Rhizodiscina lignyota]